MSPEYMGFMREKDKSLEAFFLDDALGMVIHTEKGLSVNAGGRIIFHAGNEICLESIRKFELKHPKAREEQAWIRMDCAKMQLGGKQILQSGNERREGVGNRRKRKVFSETECAEIAVGMMPICWSEGMYQAEAENLEIMQCLMADTVSSGIINFYRSDDILAEEAETKVIAGVDSEDSEDDGEMKALVYAKGIEVEGYVLNGKTYVYQELYMYRRFLQEVLERKLNDNEVYLSVEEIAEMTNCMDILSSWQQSENLRIVICNSDAKTAHLKVVRKENQMEINLYVMLKFWYCPKKGEPEEKVILDEQKFTEEESEGSAKEIFKRGVKLWEGTYNNQTSKDTGIVYDDFGMDGLINVKVNIFYEDDYKKDNSISKDIDLLEGRGKNSLQKFIYVALIDNKKGNFNCQLPFGDKNIDIEKDVDTDKNRSFVRRYKKFWYCKSVLSVLYRSRVIWGIRYDNFNTFLWVISHEMGHVFGLGDAYDRSKEKKDNEGKQYMVGAKITDEVPKNDMMFELGIITPNDIEMILEAWKTAEVQEFFNASIIGYKKSSVIRQEKKDNINFWDIFKKNE